MEKSSAWTSRLGGVPLQYIVPVAVALLAWLFPKVAEAQEGDTLSVCIFEFEPLNYFSEDGAVKGIYPDLLRRIFKGTHKRLRFDKDNWANCLKRVESNQTDLMITIGWSSKRAQKLDFTKVPVLNIWGQVFIKPKSRISTILDLEGKKVALMRRDINGQHFVQTAKTFGVKYEPLYVDNLAEVLMAVKEGAAHAGVTPHLYGNYNARKYGLVGSAVMFSPFSVYFATKKGTNAQVLAKIDWVLTQWKRDKDSFYHQCIAEYMSHTTHSSGTSVIPRWVKLGVALILFFSLLLFAWNRTLKLRVDKQTAHIKEREFQYKNLIENASSAILRIDHKGNLLFINHFGEELFGLHDTALVGKNVHDFVFSHEGEFDLEQLKESPNKAVLFEEETRTAQGHTLYMQWNTKPLFDEKGAFREILAIGLNITERKRLQKELYQSQKLEAIGTLAGGIAHDFNNILAVILGYSEMLLESTSLSQEEQDDMEQISIAALRARDLVKQILAFSRSGPTKKILLDTQLIVKEVVKLIRATIPSSIELKVDTAEDLHIFADPSQFHQIVMNLCTNAFQAQKDSGGEIVVSTSTKELSRSHSLVETEILSPGTYMLLEVADKGPGVAPHILQHIFEPYFTTKEHEKGTGLGLAVVHGIVKDHGGHIEVVSPPGEGATFRVYLKANNTSNLPTKGDAQLLVEDLKGDGETILIVEDEEQLSGLLEALLTRHNYKVLVAQNGKEGLALFHDHRDTLFAVITDMTMPVMSGADMARSILKISPNTLVILCTGFSDRIDREQAKALGVSHYFEKPVPLHALLSALKAKNSK